MQSLVTSPIPQATRIRVARIAAATLLVLVLVGGGIGILLNQDEVPFPVPVLIALTLVLAAGLGWIARAPWDRVLRPLARERVLWATCLLPVLVALPVQLVDEPGDTAALLFIVVIATISPMIVAPTAHALGVVTVAVIVLVDSILDGFTPLEGYALSILGTVAILSALAAREIGAAVVTASDREHEAEDASRALRAVIDAARTATTSDPQAVLDAVVTATANLQSDTAGMYLLHEDGLLRYGATYRIPDHLTDEAFPPTHGLAGQALTNDRTVATNDYGTDARGMAEYQEAGLRAAVASPVRVAGTPVGVLVVGRFEPGGYSPAEVSAIELLADHAGHALALSRAIDEDRQLLRRLQSLRALQEDFVATVSHELRTPLTVIDGLAETIEQRRDALDGGQMTTLLSRLRANTTTLTTIVTSILDAARLDRGLVEVDPHPVDLWDLVQGCVGRLAPVLEDHTVGLDLDDVVVAGDEGLLARVIDNLLTNVERHTPPGTTVHVVARAVGGECTVVVRDDGPGIAPRDLHRITDRFTRGGDLNTRATHGIGLGLALADQILRLHGTRLLVTSPPGGGAQFQFRLRTVDEVTPPG